MTDKQIIEALREVLNRVESVAARFPAGTLEADHIPLPLSIIREGQTYVPIIYRKINPISRRKEFYALELRVKALESKSK